MSEDGEGGRDGGRGEPWLRRRRRRGKSERVGEVRESCPISKRGNDEGSPDPASPLHSICFLDVSLQRVHGGSDENRDLSSKSVKRAKLRSLLREKSEIVKFCGCSRPRLCQLLDDPTSSPAKLNTINQSQQDQS